MNSMLYFVSLVEGQSVSFTASHMYLVITTGIWMNKSMDRPNNTQNVPFGVFGVMLPYKTVRSTHFSDLCVCISICIVDILISSRSRVNWTVVYAISLTRMDTLCLLVNSKVTIERYVRKFIYRTKRVPNLFLGWYWQVFRWIRGLGYARYCCQKNLLRVKYSLCTVVETIRKIFVSREKMVDFQGVCLHKQIVQEKSSGHMFRSVCSSIHFVSFCKCTLFQILYTISSMIWGVINHIAM